MSGSESAKGILYLYTLKILGSETSLQPERHSVLLACSAWSLSLSSPMRPSEKSLEKHLATVVASTLLISLDTRGCCFDSLS